MRRTSLPQQTGIPGKLGSDVTMSGFCQHVNYQNRFTYLKNEGRVKLYNNNYISISQS